MGAQIIDTKGLGNDETIKEAIDQGLVVVKGDQSVEYDVTFKVAE